MLRPARARIAALALAALAVVALTSPAADADPQQDKGRMILEAHLEPADLAPGQSGHLVVTTHIERDLHIYADGDEQLVVRPIVAAGVTFTLPAGGLHWEAFVAAPGGVAWTEPVEFLDDYPGAVPYPVWKEGHDFTLTVPVTLAADVAPDAKIGLEFDYSACDSGNCYPRIQAHAALAAVPGGGAPVPPAPPGGAVVSDGAGPSKPSPLQDAAATVTLELEMLGEIRGTATVTFTPSFGYHLYMPGAEGWPIEVVPLADEGVTWSPWAYPEEGEPFSEPYQVVVPFELDGPTKMRIRVAWQGCDDVGRCERPQEETFEVTWAGETVTPMIPPDEGTEPSPAPPPPEVPEIAEGEKVLVRPSETLPFPVVHGDDAKGPRTDDDWETIDATDAPTELTATSKQSEVAKDWANSWVLTLLGVFGFGVLLAFTPCVLPIIPLTISVIGGGNPNISRPRLTVLLSVYVLGLSLTYGAAGAASGALGKSVNLEAAFRSPTATWVIAGFFLLLGAGMLGIFELQPPAWMERMRGGAQRKSGTLVGSFLLGCLAAVIASPCTGPFVVALLAFVATMQSPMIGFILFFTLGFGMGAVFFAAGSLNLLVRPGPWMVYVRYAFGIILAGVALFYLASSYLISPTQLFVIGFLVAVVAWFAVYRHLVKREGERPSIARFRGAVVAILLVVATGAVAFLTRRAEGLEYVTLRDVAHLRQEVERAKEEGRPVVVDVWATWCTYCKEYDKVIAGDPALSKAFKDMVFLKIDESEGEPQWGLRSAVGLGEGQPQMVFFDEEGRIRRGLDIEQWHGAESAAELKKRIDFLYRRAAAP